MGFGHRVYITADPRNVIIKSWSKKLSDNVGDKDLYVKSEIIEKFMWDSKKLFPNLDFYSASAYHFMEIPTNYFTPIFIMSRESGCIGHILEQRKNNKIIRPNAEYIGGGDRVFKDIKNR